MDQQLLLGAKGERRAGNLNRTGVIGVDLEARDKLREHDLHLDDSEVLANAHARSVVESLKGKLVLVRAFFGKPAVRVELLSVLAPDRRVQVHNSGRKLDHSALRDEGAGDFHVDDSLTRGHGDY